VKPRRGGKTLCDRLIAARPIWLIPPESAGLGNSSDLLALAASKIAAALPAANKIAGARLIAVLVLVGIATGDGVAA